jgi:hypothetical protein
VGFTTVQNQFIDDARLSFQAKGIMLYVLSKPDHWRISERSLAAIGPDGRHTVRGALKELEEAGYIRRTRVRLENGTFEWQSMIFETPVGDAETPPVVVENHTTVDEKPTTVARFPIHGLTIHGKPRHIVNTEQVNTEQEEGGDASVVDGAALPPPPPPPAPPVTVPATPKTMTDQPPVLAYREIFLRTPSKAQMALILAHQIADLDRWRAVCTLWCGRGWNLTNIAGMLDLYDHPERLDDANNYTTHLPAARAGHRPGNRPATHSGGSGDPIAAAQHATEWGPEWFDGINDELPAIDAVA